MHYGTEFLQIKKIVPSKRTLKEWKSEVPSWIRVYMFFISGITDMNILTNLHSHVCTAVKEGWSMVSFIDKGFDILENCKNENNKEEIKALYNIERLRNLYETQRALTYGYNQFVDDFDFYQLQVYPIFVFYRQAGAKTKRFDHVKNEGVIRLKTDFSFWTEMNNEEDGGFGLPYAPFGFRSWMRCFKEDRETAEKLGLIKPMERLFVSPSTREKWGLPILYKDDLNDPERLKIVDELKKWGVWEIREKMLTILPQPKEKEILPYESTYKDKSNYEEEIKEIIIEIVGEDKYDDFMKECDNEVQRLYNL